MTQVAIGPDDGWQGPFRPETTPYAALMRRLEAIERELAALQRAAPGRASGVEMAEDGVTFSSKLTANGATTIIGVGMNTFIPQMQSVRAEVIAARGSWPDIGTRMTQISSKADAVESEVTAARGVHENLGTRMTAISTKGDDALSAANAVQSEVTAARGGQANLNARLNSLPTSSSITNLQNQITSLANSTNSGFNQLISAINVLRNLHGLSPLPPM